MDGMNALYHLVGDNGFRIFCSTHSHVIMDNMMSNGAMDSGEMSFRSQFIMMLL